MKGWAEMGRELEDKLGGRYVVRSERWDVEVGVGDGDGDGKRSWCVGVKVVLVGKVVKDGDGDKIAHPHLSPPIKNHDYPPHHHASRRLQA